MKERLKKILIVVLCWMAMMGFVAYEAYSIVRKEYNRQVEIVSEVREDIDFNLDMIKIGVQTGDAEVYAKNLVAAREGILKIRSFFLVISEQEEFLQKLGEYAEMLEGRTGLLVEAQRLKEAVGIIGKSLSEEYGDKDTISREKVKEAEAKIKELKIDVGEYEEEKALAVVGAINEMLETLATQVAADADCIDTCYKNRINEINDELAEKIEDFGDEVVKLNKEIEKEFDLVKMKELRQWQKGEK